MDPNTYCATVWRAIRDRRWEIFLCAKEKSLEELVSYIGQLFSTAVEVHDDERAGFYLAYLWNAMLDVGLAGFLSDDRRRVALKTDADFEAFQKRANEAQVLSARRLIGLYWTIPESLSQRADYLVPEQAHNRGDIDRPTLIETKRALWALALGACYDARTPAGNSDAIFRNFVDAFRTWRTFNGKESRDTLIDILRKATGENAETMHILRHIKILKRIAVDEHYLRLSHHELRYLAKILLIAYTRNTDCDKLIDDLERAQAFRVAPEATRERIESAL